MFDQTILERRKLNQMRERSLQNAPVSVVIPVEASVPVIRRDSEEKLRSRTQTRKSHGYAIKLHVRFSRDANRNGRQQLRGFQ